MTSEAKDPSEPFSLWNRLPMFWEAPFPPSRSFVELWERFGTTGGVYVIAAPSRIIYVGQTRLFRVRVAASIARHHRDGPHLANRLDWYPADNARDRMELERRLITELCPSCNIVRPKPSAPRWVPEHHTAHLRGPK